MTPARRPPSPAAGFVLCAAAVAAVALAAHCFGWVLCPLKRLTGIPCPTCGTTRACLLLLRGEVRAAFATQPFALAALPLLASAVLFPRVRALAAALWKRPAAKVFCLFLLLADWLYVLLRAN